jgi:transcriptional regulator with XRE-family HTH domain
LSLRITANTEIFAKARILKGLSQRELAKLAGLSHSYISLLEGSQKSASPATAKTLSDLLDKPIEELFTIK